MSHGQRLSTTIHNNPQQMLTNANEKTEVDESGLKRTVFRDTVFYSVVKITSVNLNISGHI